MFDTNVIIPAGLYTNGVCAKAYNKAVNNKKFSVIVCTYSLEEYIKKAKTKFVSKFSETQMFLNKMLKTITIVNTPSEKDSVPEEKQIRDAGDRPILRAAIAENVDILVTGDKDFLESGLTKPKIISPVDFANMNFIED